MIGNNLMLSTPALSYQDHVILIFDNGLVQLCRSDVNSPLFKVYSRVIRGTNRGVLLSSLQIKTDLRNMENCHHDGKVLTNGSWFNEISYFGTREKIENHILDYLNQHPDLDEPFYVGDLSDVLEKYRLWKQELPNVELYYAMKAFSDPMVLKLLACLGCSFDCASKAEIETILKLGVPPSKIMYSHPYKFVSYLKYAYSVGVRCMVFDSEDELKKIHQHCPSARLVIRVKPKKEVTCYLNMGEKFGCSVSEAHQLLKKARDLDLVVEGISFYVGHCTEIAAPYEDAVSVARQVYDDAQALGHNITILDIGGGFHGSADRREMFFKVTAGIRNALKEHFPEDIRILGEPGQFMCISAFSVYAKVVGTRSRHSENDGAFLSVYMSGGHFGCIPNYSFQNNRTQIELVTTSDEEDTPVSRPIVRTKFWGPTCDPMDKLIELMYPVVKMGEWLRFTNMGAYTVELMTRFNGFPFAKVKYVATPEIRSYLGKETSLKTTSVQE